MTIKEIKKDLGLKDRHIAEFFGFKNVNSYRNASRKNFIEQGIIEIFRRTIDSISSTKSTDSSK